MSFLVRRDNARLSVDGGPRHVHGLGLDPRDDALFIASHTGLYRVRRGEAVARRVSDRHQDTTGFTVVGPDRLLASGHPDPRDNLPPLLGLVESHDYGKSWIPVSLLGEADFHILRARDKEIVGYDATKGQILTSRDGGAHWRRHPFAGPLVDIVIAPARCGLCWRRRRRNSCSRATAGAAGDRSLRRQVSSRGRSHGSSTYSCLTVACG